MRNYENREAISPLSVAKNLMAGPVQVYGSQTKFSFVNCTQLGS